MRDKLNQNVERGRDREREIDRAGHRPRRILDLAARDERDFDAEEREEEKQDGIAQGLRAGPTRPRHRRRFDEENADGHED